MSENSDNDDDRWLIVKGRRWRRTDPALEPSVIEELKSHLGAARNAVKQAKKRDDENDLSEARQRVNVAKHGLGERGEYWWEMMVEDRRRRAEAALNELR
ncbi:biopolymer transporter Tol [Brevibacterium sp. CFH 10365]|uniref:biopolymer transporter Tol n=1 Tax=Brevibacterium sp. CFH 10365 TaxID=2585207 RepID=UPI0012660EDC|nr:biopolymer transporter Tol [Brevibacterium sp. CFH 10365]